MSSSLNADVEDIRKQYRILGLSAFDLFGTIAGSYIISRYFNIDFTRTTIVLLIGGEVI